MKKKYMIPELDVVELKQIHPLLTGSDVEIGSDVEKSLQDSEEEEIDDPEEII